MKKIITSFKYAGTLLLAASLFNPVYAQTNTFPTTGSAGIGTTTPDASSALEIASTTKGILIPRMTKTQRDAIVAPKTALLIYQTNSTPGFYYYDGTAWTGVSSKGPNKNLSNLTAPTAVNVELLPATDNTIDIGSTGSSWKNLYLDGDIYIDGGRYSGNNGLASCTFWGLNAGINNTGSANSFFGEDTGPNTTGNYNSFFGVGAGYYNTSGFYNSFFGTYAGYQNTSGYVNSFFGEGAGDDNTTGNSNSFFGQAAGSANTTGNYNSFFGQGAGGLNSTAGYNSFFGQYTGQHTNSGEYNSFFGQAAGQYNSTGEYNSFFGQEAGNSNSSGDFNSFFGQAAGRSNTSGGFNSLFGDVAGYSNTTGLSNTANGYSALYTNTIGNYNTATGYGAGSHNDADNSCSFFGYDADQSVTTDFTNSTAIGNTGRITASNQVRIGNSSITSIGGYEPWTDISDSRFKKQIEENVPGIEFINKLKPVTYHLDVTGLRKFLGEDKTSEEGRAENSAGIHTENTENTALIIEGVKKKEQIVYTGFIAQEVEVAAKELGYDFSGVDVPQNEYSLYGLRYSQFVVPLVKAVQELSDQNERLRMINAELDKRISVLETKSIMTFVQAQASPIGGDLEEALLGQNIPNPFNNSTIIAFRIPQDCKDASIMISESATGKIVKVIPVACNETQLTIQAEELSSGTYSYSLYVDGKLIQTKQMAIVR